MIVTLIEDLSASIMEALPRLSSINVEVMVFDIKYWDYRKFYSSMSRPSVFL